MFMRTGFIVGQAGILAAIGILALCKLITVLTGLSISAISTNTQVEGGGAYFLISRSLGPEFGGAIGLTLYLAQAVSVPFYHSGLHRGAGALVGQVRAVGAGRRHGARRDAGARCSRWDQRR